MTGYRCSNELCTVAQTGVCVLNNAVSDCPNISLQEQEIQEGDSTPASDHANSLGEPVLATPVAARRFSPSAAVGTIEAAEMMRKRRGKIIGILGAPDSGKTASLVSLYLLLSHDRLDGFEFASSRSLRVLDDLTHGARNWNDGAHPDQMTSHTELGAGRSAAYLHLRLRRERDNEPFDLFIPDLPGEWTTSFVDINRTDRLEFLRGAHAIWLMIDGNSLLVPARKMNAIHRAKKLIDRLAALCGEALPAVHLVITRLDLGTADQVTIDKIVGHAEDLGIALKVHQIASFTSEGSAVEAGTGISQLIDATLDFVAKPLPLWPSADCYGTRNSLRFTEGARQ